MNNSFFGGGARMTLKTIADLIGADVVDTIKVGHVISNNYKVPDRSLGKATKAAELLAA